jgi:hypothetical protein
MDPLNKLPGWHWNHHSLEDFNLNLNIYECIFKELKTVKSEIQTHRGGGEREIQVVMAMDQHCTAHMRTMLWTVHAT